MELLTVVAIIAILAAVAYPNYIRVKQNTRRADAHAAVLATQAIVERYLSESNKGNIDNTDMALSQFTSYAAAAGSPVLTGGGYYKVSIVPDASAYTINATAIANGGTTACSTVAIPEAYDQCADTDCWVISMAAGNKQSTNSVGTVANASTTTCW